MKYHEMSADQKDAFKDMLITVLNVKSQEEQQYTQQFFKLLILSNGGAIVLLATFMAALVQLKERLHLVRRR
jgi:hypothetical protein